MVSKQESCRRLSFYDCKIYMDADFSLGWHSGLHWYHHFCWLYFYSFGVNGESIGFPSILLCGNVPSAFQILFCRQSGLTTTEFIQYKKSAIAAINELCVQLVRNLQNYYISDNITTVDEQLVNYRDQIPGRTYMPSKPQKYVIKNFWAHEAHSGNALFYTGKDGRKHIHKPLSREVIHKIGKKFQRIWTRDCI